MDFYNLYLLSYNVWDFWLKVKECYPSHYTIISWIWIIFPSLAIIFSEVELGPNPNWKMNNLAIRNNLFQHPLYINVIIKFQNV